MGGPVTLVTFALLLRTRCLPGPSTEGSPHRLTRAALGGKGTGRRRAKVGARLPFPTPLRRGRGSGVSERAAGIGRLVAWRCVPPPGQQVCPDNYL